MAQDIGADEIFRVGGFMFSRTSVCTKIDGVPYTGIIEVNGGEKREGEFQYGQRPSGRPLGVTSGLYAPDAFTFKAYIETGEMICEQLAAIGRGSFGNVLFPFILEIFENPTLPTMSIAWDLVKIESRKFALPTDAGGLLYEFECKHQGMSSRGEGIGLSGLESILGDYATIGL